ncbi:hypothetical protein ON010_g210 [Phytophthora cinnamomi]|nr:hypothetical protein ON010_g210 [Phytophthora cinnamomi]
MKTLKPVARGFDGRAQQRTVSIADLDVRCSSSIVTVPFVFWRLNYDYDGILGRPWLEASNSNIDWPTRTLTWPADSQDLHSRPHDDVDEDKTWPKGSDEHIHPVPCRSKIRFSAGAGVRRVAETNTTSRRRSADRHDIVLKSGATPSARSPFRHARIEEQQLAKFVKELLGKNNIEESGV